MNTIQRPGLKKWLQSADKVIIITLMAALVIFLVGAGLFFMKTPSQIQALSVLEETSRDAETNALSILPQPIEVDPLDEIRPQLQELTRQQTALKDQLGKHNTALEQIRLQVTDLQNGFSETTKQIQAQSSQILEQIKQKKPPRIVKRRRLHQRRPQWVLASIDQWGDNYTAVLNHQQQLVTLKQGDHYQNWQLIQIDPANHQIELVDAGNKHLTLRVNQ